MPFLASAIKPKGPKAARARGPGGKENRIL